MSSTLNGNWTHRSFRNEGAAGGAILAVPWAPDGALVVTTDSDGLVTGELTFPLTGAVLAVSGQINPPVAKGVAAPWPMPASVELRAVIKSGTAEYRLRGWFIPNTNTVVGTVMAIKDDLARQPDGTLGSWVLAEG